MYNENEFQSTIIGAMDSILGKTKCIEIHKYLQKEEKLLLNLEIPLK